MAKKINKTQEKVFNYIKEALSEKGIAPSIREIGDAVGLRSTSTVQYNLNALERAGYIERDPALKRTIRLAGSNLKTTPVPLLGTVTAGVPILAQEQIEEYIPVSLGKSGEYFALHVKGSSMINAHILDGDIIIVEKTPVAQNGDIVVALIEDEATVKRFFKENGHFRLQPENDEFEPIIVKEVALLGRVVSLIRNY
ncbi:MAG: transcriptional repressor LexA [Clostridiales bacterium]|nr:transcriptional repressor LexA [Clostridiales bacterium]MCD7871981.1 transcriptional repressor LexA [Clostridiales bacterium]